MGLVAHCWRKDWTRNGKGRKLPPRGQKPQGTWPYTTPWMRDIRRKEEAATRKDHQTYTRQIKKMQPSLFMLFYAPRVLRWFYLYHSNWAAFVVEWVWRVLRNYVGLGSNLERDSVLFGSNLSQCKFMVFEQICFKFSKRQYYMNLYHKISPNWAQPVNNWSP